jgi:D-arabinose 1-dehydrogenase-like Zn-dependent alcohol dehydrogenase
MSTITEQPCAPGLSQPEPRVDSPTRSDATHEKTHRADSPLENGLPFQQNVALLHAARQRLILTRSYPVPVPNADDELVVEIRAIGLNPVDWKSMYAPWFEQTSDVAENKSSDYNFAIPSLPYIAGRDFAGVVIQAPAASSRIRIGDLVRGMVVSSK